MSQSLRVSCTHLILPESYKFNTVTYSHLQMKKEDTTRLSHLMVATGLTLAHTEIKFIGYVTLTYIIFYIFKIFQL